MDDAVYVVLAGEPTVDVLDAATGELVTRLRYGESLVDAAPWRIDQAYLRFGRTYLRSNDDLTEAPWWPESWDLKKSRLTKGPPATVKFGRLGNGEPLVVTYRDSALTAWVRGE